MQIKEFLNRIYLHVRADFSHPNRKNHGIFITRCFVAAGSTFFSYHPGRRVTSEKVAYQRKIYDGSCSITDDMQQSFPAFNTQGLAACFEEWINPEEFPDVARAFGIPPTKELELNTSCLCMALALQFKKYVDLGGGKAEVEDTVSLEYQNLTSQKPLSKEPDTPPVNVLYPGDCLHMNSEIGRRYTVSCDERFSHMWDFSNTGTQTWRGRRLRFSNHAEVRPRAEANDLPIPDTAPGKNVKVTVKMDARSFEGVSECQWVMVDRDENNCFPNSRSFFFVVEATFHPDKE